MASLWFLKCIDHLAWPLLALGYPLCASVQAIETDSYAETRNLITYWILFSLTYLFEYAFLRLLEWFQFWPYVKLVIILWLIIPDFGRASYVYNRFIHSSISTKPQAVISRLKNWKTLIVKKENFLQQAERYIKENGTEALEELITSKANTKQKTMHNPDAKATNAFRATDKKEMQQISEKKLKTESKDIKVLEVIEKNEISSSKQDAPAMPNPALSNTASSAVVEIKGMVMKDAAVGELPESSTRMNWQKEWSCALCQVTTSCERNFNTHLQGRKHRAACEALKVKNEPAQLKFVPGSVPLRNDQSNEESKQKNIINQQASLEQKNIQIWHAKERAQTNKEPEKSMLNDAAKHRITTNKENKSEGDRKGVQIPANKTQQFVAKPKNGESMVNNGLKGKVLTDHEKVHELQMNNLGNPFGVNKSKLRCELCNVNCPNEGDMASHLNGMKHFSQALGFSFM